MSHLPPGPYYFETTAPEDKPEGNGHVYLCDVNGRKIASIWGPADSKIALADFIIEAEMDASDRRCPKDDL